MFLPESCSYENLNPRRWSLGVRSSSGKALNFPLIPPACEINLSVSKDNTTPPRPGYCRKPMFTGVQSRQRIIESFSLEKSSKNTESNTADVSDWIRADPRTSKLPCKARHDILWLQWKRLIVQFSPHFSQISMSPKLTDQNQRRTEGFGE